MARTPQEIFAHHIHALVTGDIDELVTGDIDELVADYADDCAVITSSGVARGQDGVRAVFTELLAEFSHAVFDTRTQIFERDMLFLEWMLDSPAARTDGADTFVFGDGLIRVQTISHSVHPKG